MKMHLQEQVSKYGSQVLVNLINQKGHEKPVKDAYERYLSQVGDFLCGYPSLLISLKLNLPNVRYQYFDFHNECKNMRWDRISVLFDKIQDNLEQQGCVEYCHLFPRHFRQNVIRYFHLNESQGTVVKSQSGTVRTNCMDNLDRTNVAQAALAKWTVNKMLRELGVIPEGAGIVDYEAFSKDFRERGSFWSDNQVIQLLILLRRMGGPRRCNS